MCQTVLDAYLGVKQLDFRDYAFSPRRTLPISVRHSFVRLRTSSLLRFHVVQQLSHPPIYTAMMRARSPSALAKAVASVAALRSGALWSRARFRGRLHPLTRTIRVIVLFRCVLITLGVSWLCVLLFISGFRLIALSGLLSSWLSLLVGLPDGLNGKKQEAEKYKNTDPSSESHGSSLTGAGYGCLVRATYPY